MELIGFPEEFLGQPHSSAWHRKGPSAGISLHISSYVGAQGEHWSGTHPGPSVSGSEFSCLLLSFLAPTHFHCRAWGFGVPQGSLTTQHRRSALACSGARTSTRLPSAKCGPASALPCMIAFFSPLPLLLPSRYRGNPVRSRSLHQRTRHFLCLIFHPTGSQRGGSGPCSRHSAVSGGLFWS